MNERIEPGLFSLDDDDPRVVRGLLLPYGVAAGQPLAGEAGTMFAAGDVEIPADATVATLNREHNRFDPIGRAVELVDEPGVGILAAFRIAETPEGDAYLAEYSGGRRRQLSPEIAKYVNAAGAVVRRVLTGAAATMRGAFAGAELFSITELDAGELEAGDLDELIDNVRDAIVEHAAAIGSTPDEVRRRAIAELELELAPVPDEPPAPVIAGGSSTDPEPPAAPAGGSADHAAHAAEPPAGELDETGAEAPEDGENNMGDAMAPASLGTGTPAADDERKLTKGDLFAAVMSARTHGVPIPADFRTGAELFPENAGELFALGAATGNLGNVLAPQYVGQVYEGGDYVQKWLPLFAHGDLTSLTVTGWRSVSRPTVAAYAGDGAPVGGTAFTTELVTENAQRFAGGNTLPREYYDFHAAEFVDAWGRFGTNDYKRKADGYVRTQVLAAATAMQSTVPAGGEPSLPVIRRIIDGVFAIGADPINARATFAMIPDEDFKLLLHTGHSDLLEYLALALNVDGGNMLNFHLGYDSTLAAGSVVVGAREGVKVRELPGVPIRINAANVAAGSFDEALFGYVHVMDEMPEAVVVVTDAP